MKVQKLMKSLTKAGAAPTSPFPRVFDFLASHHQDQVGVGDGINGIDVISQHFSPK
jgi:hypothetical protein